ncbi:alpha/beta fold hydrolase [candidate division KSB1 bacterium]
MPEYRNSVIIMLLILIIFNSAFAQQQRGRAFTVPDINIERAEKMVDVGGRKLHCFAYGKGSPSVILVSGFNGPQETWNAVVPALAEMTTVVTYDRAGYGKSEIGGLPAHGIQSAKDLKILLEELNVPKPYVLVGHSYGERVVSFFTSMYPENMGGLIILDGQHPDILDEQRKVLKGRDLERLNQMTSMMRTPQNPKTEADYMFITLEQAKKIGNMPQIPYFVVTSGSNREGGIPPGFSDEGREKLVELGIEVQKKLVDRIPGGKHIILDDVSHYMQLEKPKPVIKIITDMVETVKKEINK